ncbi:hypothetical protein HMPREF9069_01787 [Atopobium sp. oral taxon 810 str. F0209]|nr:hypothetical protein HMPREF9069_01787 [Atopobium sp. oral taxon 810 str. F0209]
MKNRQCERLAMTKLIANGYLRDDMMPLVEVIREELDYMRDPNTGEYLRYPKKIKGGKIRHEKVKDPDVHNARTLQMISELFPDRQVFVDYFRCDLSKYEHDAEEVGLVVELTLSLERYKKKLLGILEYSNLIPVITIKHGIDMLSPSDIREIVDQIRLINSNRSIAIRIDGLDGYADVIKEVLTAKDFLIYDFNETPIRSKPDECMKLKKMQLDAHKIALCSPRPRDAAGKDFPNGAYAKFINNSHLDCYKSYGFDSVGDYGGLRDKLPSGGVATNGRALILMYIAQLNTFKSFVCDDVKKGSKGFRVVLPKVIADPELNPDGTCLALNAATKSFHAGKEGTYALWIEYTLTRYIQQIATWRPLFA